MYQLSSCRVQRMLVVLWHSLGAWPFTTVNLAGPGSIPLAEI